jgi:hypothetical protein
MRLSSALIIVAIAAGVAAACGGGGGGDPASDATVGATPSPRPSPTDEEKIRGFNALGGDWRTNFSRALVAPSEFLSGGPGKDGIPAIDTPQFVSVAEVDFLDDREPVVVVERNGDARAYPVQILIWHEIANDVVGDEPILVSYCPLCNSTVVFKRTIDGQLYDFGVSGFLRNSDLVMYDRQTESWWQQITGEALVGDLAGTVLEPIPSSTISFADFRAAHPDGLVLSRDTGFSRNYGRNPYVGYDSNDDPFLFSGRTDDRLDAVDRVVALEIDGEAVAYAFSRLESEPVVNDDVGGQPIVVLFRKGTVSPLDRSAINDSADVGSGVAFSRSLEDRVLTFASDGDTITDAETGSEWTIDGRAVDGPLAGKRLEPVVHGNHFWFAWAAFKPDTRVWPGGGDGETG